MENPKQIQQHTLQFEQMIKTLSQQHDDLKLINALNSAVIHRESLNNILSLLSKEISRIYNCLGVTVYLLNRDETKLEMQDNTLHPKIISTIEKVLRIKLPSVKIIRSTKSTYFKTLSSNKPAILTNDKQIIQLIEEFTDSNVLRKLIPGIYKVLEINSVIIFPLSFGNTALGIMDISRDKPFSTEEFQRLQQVVPQLTEAVIYHKAIQEKEELFAELQEAYNKVKRLSGLIPICAQCKKIRDDSGYWNQVESYITEHSDAVFSHGICPDCMEKLYPEYVKTKK
ncbi:MAG: hypothetical protein KAU06_10660 [Candidatus Marinimicrobia bacterium]|nr:hypothetical protein [Candidatus Neomarinimicrobiota bacterium]